MSWPTAYVVAVDPSSLVLPSVCACCEAVAAHALVERRPSDRAAVFVPYCTDCFGHASAVRTRWLVSALASGVLGLTAEAAAPLMWPFIPGLSYALVVLLVAALPFGALLFRWRVRPRSGHSSTGRALWWTRTGELVCTSARYVEELALSSQARSVRTTRQREPRFVRRVVTGWVLVALGLPWAWRIHHPLVRIVNLSDAQLTVRVDGRRMIDVGPTSVENARAGAEIRIPAGRRQLSAEGPGGRVLARASVGVHGMREHLYAPTSEGYCFWLETTVYGRTEPERPGIIPLLGHDRFWVLPGRVDTWFNENPAAASDRRSSGGQLTALRQARCADAPDDVAAANRE